MGLLLLDLDGTIRRSKSGAKFINDPHDQELIPGAAEAMTAYAEAGFTLVGVTNQGGVAHGFKTELSMIAEQEKTLELSPKLAYILACPDMEGRDCWCIYRHESHHHEGHDFRKPGIGMVHLAEEISRAEATLMVGDMESDRDCAKAANIGFAWAEEWIELPIDLLLPF